MNIGKKIHELRTSKMMTQSELAGDCITRNMLSLIEKGTALPSLQTVSYLAKKLGVSVGFLLSEESEEAFYRKSSLIGNIKKAYSENEVTICRDLCFECINQGAADDEIKLIAAECDIKIAENEMVNGSLKAASDYIYEALGFCEETMYNTKHIEILASAYSDYMSSISPSLNLGLDACEYYICGDDFYKYIFMFSNIRNIDISAFSPDDFKNTLYYKHLQAMTKIEEKDFSSANKILDDILKADEKIPRTMLYCIFSDLEKCCKENDDFKGAYEYSANKIQLFEKMLSEI